MEMVMVKMSDLKHRHIEDEMPKEKKTKNLPSVAKKSLDDSKSYSQVFELLKSDIRQAQLRAALSVTRELTLLYWRTGKMISEKVIQEGWGGKNA